jgi:hypothetical protein
VHGEGGFGLEDLTERNRRVESECDKGVVIEAQSPMSGSAKTPASRAAASLAIRCLLRRSNPQASTTEATLRLVSTALPASSSARRLARTSSCIDRADADRLRPTPLIDHHVGMAIPQGITRDDVLQALRDLDDGVEHSFGESKVYDLVHEGRHYPPKAVIGLAARRILGRVLELHEFSGGEASGNANGILRNLGFTVIAKDQTAGTRSFVPDPDYVRATLDMIVEDWRHRGGHNPFAEPDAWMTNRRHVLDALGRLRATADLAAFATALTQLPNAPPWFGKGAHRTFLGALVDRAGDPGAAATIADAFTAPATVEEAAAKIGVLEQLAAATDKIYPGPGFAPLAASIMWCFQDPEQWPWLSSEAEASVHTLRLLPRYQPAADRYAAFRELVVTGDADPTATVSALADANQRGTQALSAAV